ncbi:hypothetical protein C4564_02070, partial [Candidatus Microgenomates bacterium]
MTSSERKWQPRLRRLSRPWVHTWARPSEDVDMSTPRDIVMQSRIDLLFSQPFYAALAMRLTVVETTQHKRMATDGKSLYYNPEWVTMITRAQLRGVICHEVMHCTNG